MEEHSFKVEKTTRYFSIGDSGDLVKELWIVLHGYGQLPAFFLRKFAFLESESRRIIAPEGLHRFYLEGTEERVGASWMTKEARLDDIADQATYLDQLLEEQKRLCPALRRVVLFGFSQGVATACRWVDHRSGTDISKLICWAGTFPPDIDYSVSRSAFENIPFWVVLGRKDPYIPIERMEVMLRELESRGIYPKPHLYDGDHSVDPKVLERILLNEVIS